ncbi:hypothetical protein RHJ80_01030 [Thermosynechococcus sp. QS41]|uniref:DUF3800 domain-containing protein n=1 Tax=Thermosynechococcus sp. QS41 TaxID=3074101 RepID=UPI00287739DD|nr:DUF3800 domain-containing protein [Thermosynechococcus sp. QS41]WNC60568.1 hypothetical protein RHJ80_01030 [Thermosynechococcus sp. QS41]
MQRNLWGQPIRRTAEYHVFHDESMPNKRWLLIGLLFVQTQHLNEVQAALQDFRMQEDYSGEIHFSDLPKNFDGCWSAKARVAQEWMRCFEKGLSDRVFFSTLAVDRHSPRYEHKRFARDFHAYNRFTAMALKAGIAWHLGPQNLDDLIVHFISDAKDRATRPDRDLTDNFEQYLPSRAELDSLLSQSPSYPFLNMDLELRDSAKEDLLQLCDLLLGATQMALVAGSSRPTKRELGEMIVRWYRDLQQPPWQQKFGLHRKFNLWAFPDQNGSPYNKVKLALNIDDGQLSLFTDSS